MTEKPENTPKHPPTFREELARPVFDRIATGESCTIIGASSMGKTRFVNSIMQPSTQEYYLEEEIENILLLHVDFNLIDEIEDWATFELILDTIINTEMKGSVTKNDQKHFFELHQFVALNKDPLIAFRYLKRAVNILIKNRKLKLCLIFDDFDTCYEHLPEKTLNKLRALRDSYKDRLGYVLLMRQRPSHLRDPLEVEHFHELVTIFTYGLKPYTLSDAQVMLNTLEKRRGKIQQELKDQILRISGGHPGMINIMHKIAVEEIKYFSLDNPRISMTKLLEHSKVKRECTSLYQSLSEKEQEGYKTIIAGENPGTEVFESLKIRGIYDTDFPGQEHRIPLFRKFVGEL